MALSLFGILMYFQDEHVIDSKMPEFSLVLVVIQYPASFYLFCLVICYVTTYKSILDKLGKKNKTEHFIPSYIFDLY